MLQMSEFPTNVDLKDAFFQVSESVVPSCADRTSCNIFKGTFNGKSVAVKKFFQNSNIHQEENHWLKLIKLRDDHVVQYHLCGIQNNVR